MCLTIKSTCKIPFTQSTIAGPTAQPTQTHLFHVESLVSGVMDQVVCRLGNMSRSVYSENPDFFGYDFTVYAQDSGGNIGVQPLVIEGLLKGKVVLSHTYEPSLYLDPDRSIIFCERASG